MPDLQNEFSWSKSRHEKFAECRRAYFYAYYGSWGGWDAEPGSPVRELYVLKKLSSRWQWAGSVVHDALKDLLRRARATGELAPVERTLARTREKARAQWAVSRDKSYWRERSAIVGLVEHEYGDVVASDDWKRLYETVIDGSIRSFYASPTLEAIRATPRERWLTVDELDSFVFEGTKIWVAIDFAYRDGDGRIQVLDWKTGRERGVDHTQVAIYARYAREKWAVPPDAVTGGLVYLVGNGDAAASGPRTATETLADWVRVAADEAAIAKAESDMRASISAMKAVLADPARNVAAIDAFAQRESRDA
ncbi:MAG TPA: PD-(D/E)XK nuclease family protein, partial [Anaeromyxobacteraceae bacterium]|nr:PD-(D/E)XK nuclease family protein [Anaeromyxobacteraceae bacterium]